MDKPLLARQSIYNKELDVVAYELLFRGQNQHEAGVDNENQLAGDIATSNVIVNTFADVGIEDVIGNHRAFINFTRNLLLESGSLPLPKEKIVIEVLEDLVIDQQLIDSVIKLADNGFTIALDDFVFNDELRPLMDVAEIIKFDVLGKNEKEIEQQIKSINGFEGKLLAEKVEDHPQFEICTKLGFDYFQGFFLSKPNLVTGKKVTANRSVMMSLLSKINDPEVEFEELEHIIVQDPNLTYKLLRILNSAAYFMGKKVESIRQAMVRLGLQQLKNWLTMIAFSSLNDKPQELMRQTVIRAKMCEVLAEFRGIKDCSSFFTVGLLSTLDALLDEAMTDILEKVALSDELNAAILEGTGMLGYTLHNVIAYEQGKWSQLDYKHYNETQYSDAYLQSIRWSEEASGTMVQ